MTDYNPEDVQWFDEHLSRATLLRRKQLWFYWYIRNPIRDGYYKILYFLFPKMQFHVIRPRTLTASYYDQDTRILHAVMEMLCDYIEECEAVGQNWDHVDPEQYVEDSGEPDHFKESTIRQIKDYHTLKDIEQWWKNDYPRRSEIDTKGKQRPPAPGKTRTGTLPADSKGLHRMVTDYQGCTPEKYKAWQKKKWKIDDDWEKLTTKHLVTIMKLRKGMWV